MLQINVTFRGIKPESLEEFTKWAEEVASLSRDEPETLGYGAFISGDGRTAVLRERYADSPAMLSHFGRVGHAVGPMVACAESVEVDAYGDVSDELKAALADFNPGIYTRIAGT